MDPAKKPKEIDVTGDEGPNKGKTMKGIYQLEKDKLKICLCEDRNNNQRPTEFKVNADSGHTLVTLERAK